MIDAPAAVALPGSIERRSGAVLADARSTFGPAERVARAAGSLNTGSMTSTLTEQRAGRPRPAGHLLAERSQELFVRGYGLLGANDRREIEAAKVLLDRAVMREPQFARAIAARGYASWRHYFAGWSRQAQELTSAICDIHEALTIDPESVQAHLTFVRVCWDMGWHEPAVAAGRLIFDRNPDSIEATVAFARALNNAGLSQYAIPLVGSLVQMINPVIVARSSAEVIDWEGCFSVPGLMGHVPRSDHVTVSYTTREGLDTAAEFVGYAARVAQHEIDHLDGVEFVDRMRSMDSLTTVQNYLSFHRPGA